MRSIEAYTPNANIAESVIRELKRTYRYTMTAKNVPEILWDRCIEWCAKVRSLTALNLRVLDGQVPETMMTGDTADVSHMVESGFFDYVWYITPQGKDKAEDMRMKRLGVYLGPAKNVGEAMCGVVLNERGMEENYTSTFPLSTAVSYTHLTLPTILRV